MTVEGVDKEVKTVGDLSSPIHLHIGRDTAVGEGEAVGGDAAIGSTAAATTAGNTTAVDGCIASDVVIL